MTLIFWKAPVVDDPDAAKALLQAYYDKKDDSAFEPSEAIARVREELLRRFPDDAAGEAAEAISPWAVFPPAETERLLVLSIRPGAEDDVLNEALDLANEHELVLYDPQGPHVYLPFRPTIQAQPSGFDFVGYAKILLFGFASVAIFMAGWWLPVPFINWLLMIVGGFLTSVVVFLLVILAGAPKGNNRP